MKYDKLIQEYVNSIKYSLYKFNFYQSYAENPLDFTSKFITQHTDLRQFFERTCNERYNKGAGNFENAQFYRYNREKVMEAVHEYLTVRDDKAENRNVEKKKRGRKRKQVEPASEPRNEASEEVKSKKESENDVDNTEKKNVANNSRKSKLKKAKKTDSDIISDSSVDREGKLNESNASMKSKVASPDKKENQKAIE